MTSFTWMFGSRLGAPKLVTLLDLKIPEKSYMIGSYRIRSGRSNGPIQQDHASAEPPSLPCPDFLPAQKNVAVQLKVKQEIMSKSVLRGFILQ